ncbi:D-ribose pyranase [Paenibacillus larvae]|uniref:D-ribose pyranase n=4 Tax=Paenibacillus larvae TaxID=1464 RepID=V9WAX3_9BACL|nr:D-ribose pyranase [Paenibacillus larvae]AHD07318.1 D-ribose pyranase RbsD [Paenibacillus larvae subsp. larvae DSM 25430]AQR79195.1 D-ribose pyranase [Paenibacillus larvae subsp. larvae]ARF68869.1 D-ribose pyranase [Paenibacillus larvae subsp. pulvifaciens]AVF23665.1 D-ribose pyranase RbsD [Paenibacillus larvae subsp. larvae]AVG13882.1 D-ribose pyranase RbsD [Paenibacillus larvae subsp. larvae DSM 25430]
MKKQGILNSHISKVLADLGHTDTIVVADVGLPIPDGVKKIDLALTLGSPSFEETVNAIASDMEIEKVIIAEEMKTQNTEAFHFVEDKFTGCAIENCPHEEFKQLTRKAKAVIRTGEAKPFANIILQAGVYFG